MVRSNAATAQSQALQMSRARASRSRCASHAAIAETVGDSADSEQMQTRRHRGVLRIPNMHFEYALDAHAMRQPEVKLG
jgi:hypothetical protein